jgi:hypothetical protein
MLKHVRVGEGFHGVVFTGVAGGHGGGAGCYNGDCTRPGLVKKSGGGEMAMD